MRWDTGHRSDEKVAAGRNLFALTNKVETCRLRDTGRDMYFETTSRLLRDCFGTGSVIYPEFIRNFSTVLRKTFGSGSVALRKTFGTMHVLPKTFQTYPEAGADQSRRSLLRVTAEIR